MYSSSCPCTPLTSHELSITVICLDCQRRREATSARTHAQSQNAYAGDSNTEPAEMTVRHVVISIESLSIHMSHDMSSGKLSMLITRHDRWRKYQEPDSRIARAPAQAASKLQTSAMQAGDKMNRDTLPTAAEPAAEALWTPPVCVHR
jgi:hypothetical protein